MIHRPDFLDDPEVKALFDLLGYQARFVGGVVRNSLLGLPAADFDIATTLKPTEVIRRADAHQVKVIPTGVDHGTVTVVMGDRVFEITTLRRDIETDGRHAIVEFSDDWCADAARRDFTINALYLDHTGQVHDYVGGLEDLENRRIRFIGNPVDRLHEDRLRALRFFRFSAIYGAGSLDPDGVAAIGSIPSPLAGLAAERVWAEFSKLLMCAPPQLQPILGAMMACGLTLDGLVTIEGVRVASKVVGGAGDHRLAILRLGAIWLASGLPVDQVSHELRLSKKDRYFLASLDRARPSALGMTVPKGREIAYTENQATALVLAALYAPDLLADIASFTPPPFPIQADDLMALGYQTGRALGAELKRLEDLFIASDFHLDRAHLLDQVTPIS